MQVDIRKWQIDDAEYLAQSLNNKKVMDNLRDGLPFPYTVEDAKSYINAMLSADKNEVFAFAVTVNGVVAGNIGIFRQSNIHSKTAELGYYLGEEYWGKGIMTETVKKACAYVFENSDIVRIYAEPFARNIASCRVLEKSGFEYEGTLKKNALKNGIFEDMKMYALFSRKTARR